MQWKIFSNFSLVHNGDHNFLLNEIELQFIDLQTLLEYGDNIWAEVIRKDNCSPCKLPPTLYDFHLHCSQKTFCGFPFKNYFLCSSEILLCLSIASS